MKVLNEFYTDTLSIISDDMTQNEFPNSQPFLVQFIGLFSLCTAMKIFTKLRMLSMCQLQPYSVDL